MLFETKGQPKTAFVITVKDKNSVHPNPKTR